MRIPNFNIDQLRHVEARHNFTARVLDTDLKLDPVLRHHLGLPLVKPIPQPERRQDQPAIPDQEPMR